MNLDDLGPVKEASANFRRQTALMIRERPAEVDALNHGLNELFAGHQLALCLSAMADALGYVLAELEPLERASMVMAFADMALQMAMLHERPPGKGDA